MIQFNKNSQGLAGYSKIVPYIDANIRSNKYFRIHDFPERFFVGKNIFRVGGAKDALVFKSTIYIDVVDSNGEIVYHEVLDVVNKDKTRTVVVYIYSDTPPGECTVYVAGRIKKNPETGEAIPYSENPTSPNYRGVPNMMWVGKATIVPNKQNNTEIFFIKEPIVAFSERRAKFDKLTTASRATDYTGSAGESLSMKSVVKPYQFSSDESKFADSFTDTANIFQPNPNVALNSGESIPASQLPEYSHLSVVKSTGDVFIKSMVGGTLYVRGIDISQFKPSDANDSAVFDAIPDYSASIVRVVNASTVYVDAPFLYRKEYKTTAGETRQIIFNSFINQGNFTASYLQETVDTIESLDTLSYVNLQFRNLEPAAGTVDSIRVAYKDIGEYGEFKEVGTFPIREQNYLIDTATLQMTTNRGLIDKEIGYITSQSEAEAYWTASQVGGVLSASMTYRDTHVGGGILVDNSGSTSEDAYMVFTLTDPYLITAAENTEYKLSVLSRSETAFAPWSDHPFVDVYISGSSITTDRIKRSQNSFNPIKAPSLGTYIGTITSKDGVTRDNDFFFIAKERKAIKPIFVVREGRWDLGQVTINPRKEVGFSPNQARLNIPLDEFKKSSELILNFQYFNNSGLRSQTETNVYGVYFTGSTPILYDHLPDKLDVQNVAGEGGKLFATVDGNSSASYAVSDILYQTSSYETAFGGNSTVLNFKNEAQIVHSTSESVAFEGTLHPYAVEYISTSNIITQSLGGTFIGKTFAPVTTIFGDLYTGSLHVAGLSFTAETSILAINGSGPLAESETTTLSSVVQGRGIVSPSETGGIFTLYNVYTNSGSGGGYGGYGTPSGILADRDADYTVSTTYLDGAQTIGFTHQINNISGTWTILLTTKTRMIKNEFILTAT